VIRRLAAAVAAAGLVTAALYVAPVAEAKGKPACHPKRGCVTTTTTAPTTTLAPTTSTTVAPTTTTTVAPTTTTTVAPTTTTTTLPPAGGQLLWFANADTDTDAGSQTGFWRKEVTSGIWSRLSIVDDPLGLYGKVYRANLTAADIEAGDNRAEWRGSYVNGSSITFGTHGQELWYGWRSMFGGDVALTGSENDGNWMQLKGDSSCGGPAVGFTIRYNRLAVRTIDGDFLAWDGPAMASLMDGSWHDFLLHVRYGKPGTDLGYLELTLDGVPQAMANGQTRIPVPTMCPDDTHVRWKLGAYSMDVGVGAGPIHWTADPKIGTSAAAVTP
jgi:hypothetical protein